MCYVFIHSGNGTAQGSEESPHAAERFFAPPFGRRSECRLSLSLVQLAKLNEISNFGFSTTGSRVKMTSGLSTAYNIVQKYHGDIKVKSEIGEGMTFTVVLPIEKELTT